MLLINRKLFEGVRLHGPGLNLNVTVEQLQPLSLRVILHPPSSILHPLSPLPVLHLEVTADARLSVDCVDGKAAVTVISTRPGRVRLGIVAPACIQVDRVGGREDSG